MNICVYVCAHGYSVKLQKAEEDVSCGNAKKKNYRERERVGDQTIHGTPKRLKYIFK